MQSNMADPAAGVPTQLLPHLHLISKYRFPSVNAISIETVINHLIEAPKIVRDLQPMHWTFLDAPADGTVYLAWQPLNYLATNFASDGYVWADAEHAFTHEARGYVLEMYMHRSGFHPPNETVTAHSRKRYRLMPGPRTAPGQAPCDPHLWLIHYSKAERRDHIPATNIPISPQISNVLRERAWLQRQGQLTRKEFMLHDKSNWPTINFPGTQHQMPGPPPGPGQPGFGRAGPLGPAPTRGQGRQARGPSMSIVEPTLEEEEDVSRGDLLDFLTPREISKMRYEQHHEWMEEIMDSPYSINQIVPVELGLGRQGGLEDLTTGFFTAPTSSTHESTNGAPARVGKMEPGKADEFKDKAEQRLASMTAELEQMRKQHAQRMAQLQKSSIYVDAERRLRNAVEDPTSSNNQSLRLERTRHGNEVSSGPSEKVADIVAEVESKTNRMAVPIGTITCIEKGGLEEQPEELPQPERIVSDSPATAVALQTDEPMSNTPDQSISQADMTLSAPATEQQSAVDLPKSSVPNPVTATPVAESSTVTDVPPTQPGPVDEGGLDQTEAVASTGGMGPDVDMEMEALEHEGAAESQPDDWVMVNEHNQGESTAGATTEGQPTVPGGDEPVHPTTNTEDTGLPNLTPGGGESDVQGGEGDGMDTGHFDLEGAFEDIDTAGEAMDQSYDAEAGDLDLGDLDDSAFGEAFHPADHGEDPADHEDV